MAAPDLDVLLGGKWRDPATGRAVELPFKNVTIAASLKGGEAELVRALGFGRRLAVVSDPTTRGVLGERVERALGAIAEVDSLILPEHPHADAETVERVRAATARDDALIAVGSGTINDLAKYASHLDRKPFAVFATAPSMNGYTSLSAAITVHGHKKSLPAHGAAGVFIDLGVFAAAPKHMVRSGLGDSLCRPTAQVDWLLSHRLRGTPYSETPFLLLADDEPALFADSAGLARGDLEAMRRLARVLVLSGIGMCLAGSSAPASQAEHLVSHYLDMMHPGASRQALGRDALHGEQIGVATLTVARLQGRLLALDRPPRLAPTRVDEPAIRARFGAGAEDCLAQFRAKAMDQAAADRANAWLESNWAALRRDLEAAYLPVDRLHAALTRAGAARTAAELGLSDALYREAVTGARFIRDRYTCLDLIDDSFGLGGWIT